MTAADLLTAGYFDEWMRALLARLPQLGPGGTPGAGPGPDEVVLYSVGKLAQVLEVHPETVRSWLKKGKRSPQGPIVKLQAYYFTSEPRIPWPAVLAYHRGEPFDLDALPAPTRLPPAELTPAPMPRLDTPPAGPAPPLRIAS